MPLAEAVPHRRPVRKESRIPTDVTFPWASPISGKVLVESSSRVVVAPPNQGGAEMFTLLRARLLVMLLALSPATAFGQAYMVPPTTQYGTPMTVESAKRAAAAALGEARKNGWFMAVAVVDPAGDLVYFEKMDNVQNASPTVAIEKATSAAIYKRPTKVFLDALAVGGQGWRTLALNGAIPVGGGIPLVVDGKIIGAIGLSGGAGDQDSRCAEARAAALVTR